VKTSPSKRQAVRVARAGVLAVAVLALGLPSHASTRIRPQLRPGLQGSRAIAQPVTLDARISRIASVPGSQKFWAIGHIAGRGSGWDRRAPLGQVHFFRTGPAGAWTRVGPPRTKQGNVRNPTLSALAFAPTGEGWAVGTRGTMVRYRPGIGWRMASACPAITCEDLVGISFLAGGSSQTGYAVGANGTVLVNRGNGWAVDSAEFRGTGVDLRAVGLLTANDAWAVGTSSSSRELQIFRRGALGWTQQKTGQPIFDNPAPSQDESGNVNLAVIGTAIAADPRHSAIWIAGGMSPVDATDPLGDPQRPFAIRWRNGTYDSYCPVQYTFSGTESTTGQGTFSVGDICDHPFPFSPFELSSLSVVPSGDVFAGGLGLFHFEGNAWRREPDPAGYLASVAFASRSEGWMAGNGDTIGASTTARSSSFTLAHFTASPDGARVARWPNFNRAVLTGVALSPDGERALAVGDDGAILYNEHGAGWIPIHNDRRRLRAVAWRTDREAWVVGQSGLVIRVLDGEVLEDHAWDVTDQTLFGVAFDGATGYAVGAGGAILRFQGGAWRPDPASGSTKETLYDVAVRDGGALAVGSGATVLINTGDSWRADPSLGAVLDLPRTAAADLFAAGVLADGTLLAGGNRGALAFAEPGEPWRVLSPLDRGMAVFDAEATRLPSGRVAVFASLSPDQTKFRASDVGATRGWPMYFDGETWTDLDHGHRMTTHPELDVSAARDPVFGVALDPGGRSGWAVGGMPAELVDDGNHLALDATSSVYRFDLDRDPSAPDTTAMPLLEPDGVTLAFFSDSACGSGPCSVTVGSGVAADTIPLSIRDEINTLAQRPGGPSFALYAGNMRAVGIPEELDAFRGYLERFDVPVFGSMGPSDLLSPSTSAAFDLMPEIPEDLRRQFQIPDAERTFALNRPFLETFAHEIAPWGTGASTHPDIVPVEIGLPATEGLARSHYAFDYAPGGTPALRVIVLDTSDKTFQKSGRNSSQNPQQDQATWIQQVAADATTHSPPIPFVIVSNVPTINPTSGLGQDRRNMMTDGPAFESQAVALRASAVLTGWVRGNAQYWYPSRVAPERVPFIIAGTAGTPIGGSHYPLDSHFHAWDLIHIGDAGGDLLNAQAEVTVRTFPVFDYVALNPVDGTDTEAGGLLLFRALGRGIDGGGPPDDPAQSKRLHIEFPLPFTCPSELIPGYGTCINSRTTRPDFQFVSEDPSIAQFVTAMYGNPRVPLRVRAGEVVPNPQSGLLCTFRQGSTHVKIVSGLHQMRIPITVGPGHGPCIRDAVLARPLVPEPLPNPRPEPAPAPLPPIPAPPNPAVVVLPPPPPPVTAPAPPAAGGYAKKEEHEAEVEESGADFQALPVQPRRASSFEPTIGWAAASLVGIAGLAFGLAWGASAPYRRRVYQRVHVTDRGA